MALNRKQTLFVHEYVIDLNATQAAIRAGYSPNGAGQSAEKLLKNAEIANFVEKLLETKRKATTITAEKLLKDCEEIKERCLQREAVLDNEGIPTGEWKFDSRGALKAIEIQGKLQGLFTEKREVDIKGISYGIIRDFEGDGRTILKAEFGK